MELQLDLTKRYTYEDYLTCFDDVKRELIDGFIHIMSPKPKLIHQEVSGNLLIKFKSFVKKNKCNCKVYQEIDVRFPREGSENGEIYDVVSPDVVIVCDTSKLDDKSCVGAPDLIVEVQSFSTAKYDLNEKFFLYEKNGVKEYWVVYPNDKGVEVFKLQSDGKYDKGTKYIKGKIPISIFNNYPIELDEIFD